MFNSRVLYIPLSVCSNFQNHQLSLSPSLAPEEEAGRSCSSFCVPYWLMTARHSLTEHLSCVNNHARLSGREYKGKLVFRVCAVLYPHPLQLLISTLVCMGVPSTAEAGVNAAVSPNHGSWLTLGPTLKALASAKLWFKGWAKSLQLSVKSRCCSMLK